jgi:GT2 family glycosyltransferase
VTQDPPSVATRDSATAPLASIIVLFMDGSPWIAPCIESVRSNVPPSVPHEIIVLANGVAGDEAVPGLEGVNVRVLRSRINLGFAGGCNWASLHARGEYLVFLNDDTRIEPGWLEALLSAAREDGVMAVGSVMLAPDGRIDEAGRVLWSDGGSSAIAAGLDLRATSLPAVREVDYASASSLLVSKEHWDAEGGFDTRYFPAYYEDVDLSLRLRLRGGRIVCASDSRLQHRRSASTTVLWRRFLGLRNHDLLVDEWKDVLARHEDRPRHQPTGVEVERSAASAAERGRAIYHDFGMRQDARLAPSPGAARGRVDQTALLARELAALQAELRIKNEYIAFLERNAPSWEQGLERTLAEERRRARRRDLVKRMPLAETALRLKRRIGGRRKS